MITLSKGINFQQAVIGLGTKFSKEVLRAQLLMMMVGLRVGVGADHGEEEQVEGEEEGNIGDLSLLVIIIRSHVYICYQNLFLYKNELRALSVYS